MPKKSTDSAIPEEATGDGVDDTVQIEWRGVTFTLPKDMDDWETEACIALAEAPRTRSLSDMQRAIRLSLGETQWELLLTLGTKRGDLTAFAEEFGRVVDEDCV